MLWTFLPSNVRTASLEERWGTTIDKVALRVQELKKIMSSGRSFGVISAYTGASKSENQKRHGDLYADLRRLGYNPKPLKARWSGESGSYKEKSWLVPNMGWRDLLQLGLKYDQDAVIFKDPSGALGLYYQKAGVAEFAVEADGDLAAEIAANQDLYSKARGISFSFGFLFGQRVPWNGTAPFTRRDVEEMVREQALVP